MNYIFLAPLKRVSSQTQSTFRGIVMAIVSSTLILIVVSNMTLLTPAATLVRKVSQLRHGLEHRAAHVQIFPL